MVNWKLQQMFGCWKNSKVTRTFQLRNAAVCYNIKNAISLKCERRTHQYQSWDASVSSPVILRARQSHSCFLWTNKIFIFRLLHWKLITISWLISQRCSETASLEPHFPAFCVLVSFVRISSVLASGYATVFIYFCLVRHFSFFGKNCTQGWSH